MKKFVVEWQPGEKIPEKMRPAVGFSGNDLERVFDNVYTAILAAKQDGNPRTKHLRVRVFKDSQYQCTLFWGTLKDLAFDLGWVYKHKKGENPLRPPSRSVVS